MTTVRSRTLPALVLVVALATLGATIAYAVDHGSGPGLMHRSGYWMTGGHGQHSAWYLDGSGPARDIPAARVQAQRFAGRLGLRTGEVMQFAENFYVRLDDRQGKPATEVLVDPSSGDVTLEYGAAMMWNTRYGTMTATDAGRMMNGGSAGMMGGSRAGMMGNASGAGMMGRAAGGMMGAARGAGPVDAAGARAVADRWLAAHGLAAAAGEPDAFPGYFTMETRHAGRIDGMVSVNARTGAVIYHWWHGPFIASQE
jgi:hypothetical protein